jgi:hypothetical protein
MEARMSAHDDVRTLSVIERQAVEVGVLDANRLWIVSGHAGGFRAKLVHLARIVSGDRGGQPLANPRLELVREFAALTHRRHRPADEIVPALLQQGYGPAQISAFAALAA